MTSLTPADALRVSRARQLALSGEARRIRLAAALPAGDMAEALGITVRTLQRWENGDRSPRGESAVQYARLLSSLARGSKP